jgi:membrane protein YdbS with pleckstrin-like domain
MPDIRNGEAFMSDPAPAHSTEQVLWTGTVSSFHYAGKWVLIFILLAAVVASFWLVLPDLGLILWAARAALLVLALLLVCWIQVDKRRRRYTVTNKRVSVDYGIVNRVSNEVRISDIRSINLQKTGFTGLLGIGRVEFSSSATDDADVIFWNTPEAEKVRDLVRSLQP